MPSRRRVIKSVKKSSPKVAKTSRKVVKSARKSVPKSARKVVKKVVKKSARKSVSKSARKVAKKSVKKSRTPKTRKYRVDPQKREYDVCILFGVYPEDEEDEEQVNANSLSDSAKALFSEKIKKECAKGFYASSFLIKNIAITFQDDRGIRLTGTVDIDPKVADDCGGTLESWVEVVNDKSVWQWSYGPNNEYHVESNGKKYKLRSVYLK